MDASDVLWRSGGGNVGESYAAWLQTSKASEKDGEDKEHERRQDMVEMFYTQQRALVMCLKVVSGVAVNNALPNLVADHARSCWKLDRRQNNFEELFGERRDGQTFKRQVRMIEHSFEKMLDLLRDRLQPSRFSRLDYMSPRRIPALTILRLAHGYTYHNLGQMFAIGISSAQKCYARGVDAICSLRVRFIRMPSTEAHIAACVSSFSGQGFPNACLAVDGCYVKVECCKSVREFWTLTHVPWRRACVGKEPVHRSWASVLALVDKVLLLPTRGVVPSEVDLLVVGQARRPQQVVE